MDERARNIEWLERAASFMDSKYKIPGTEIRFGADPILGLFPFVGDVATFVISSGLVLVMARHGASRKLVILMVLNVFLDTIIGSIPVIGNIFDFTFRANKRNVTLLKRHYEEGKYHGSGKGIIWFVVLTFLVGLVLIIFGLVKLTQYLWGLFF